MKSNSVEIYLRIRGTWSLNNQSWVSTPPPNCSIKDLSPTPTMWWQKVLLHFCQTARCHNTRAGFFKRPKYNTIRYHNSKYMLGVSAWSGCLQASGQNYCRSEVMFYIYIYIYWWWSRRERDHWGVLGVDGWIILGWVSRRWDVGMWTGLGWLRIEISGGRLCVR